MREIGPGAREKKWSSKSERGTRWCAPRIRVYLPTRGLVDVSRIICVLHSLLQCALFFAPTAYYLLALTCNCIDLQYTTHPTYLPTAAPPPFTSSSSSSSIPSATPFAFAATHPGIFLPFVERIWTCRAPGDCTRMYRFCRRVFGSIEPEKNISLLISQYIYVYKTAQPLYTHNHFFSHDKRESRTAEKYPKINDSVHFRNSMKLVEFS